MKRFNELVFSDNLYTVSHLSLISEDTAYVVYKSLHSWPNPKGNIFVAVFTISHARLHLYKAIEKLNEHVLYMDTDSVVFTQQPGQWRPRNWIDEKGGWMNFNMFESNYPLGEFVPNCFRIYCTKALRSNYSINEASDKMVFQK